MDNLFSGRALELCRTQDRMLASVDKRVEQVIALRRTGRSLLVEEEDLIRQLLLTLPEYEHAKAVIGVLSRAESAAEAATRAASSSASSSATESSAAATTVTVEDGVVGDDAAGAAAAATACAGVVDALLSSTTTTVAPPVAPAAASAAAASSAAAAAAAAAATTAAPRERFRHHPAVPIPEALRTVSFCLFMLVLV